MRHFVSAGLILALQIALSNCGETVYIDINDRELILRAPLPVDSLVNCSVVTNDGKSYSLYPINESPGHYDRWSSRCTMTMEDPELRSIGLWTMNTITNSENFITEFDVKIRSKVNVKPANYIVSQSGQWIRVGLDTNETDVTVCNVTNPHEITVDLKKETIEGASLDGHCGIRMLANESLSGEWQFSEQIGKSHVNYATFSIKVPPSDTETPTLKKIWRIKSEEKIIVTDDEKILFCQITTPDGRKMPTTFGKCEHKVPVVSEHHQGTWLASYARQGRIDIKHRTIDVKTINMESIECSYSFENDGKINILCKSPQPSLEFCSFIRPDGRFMLLPVGVGNDNYSYYGAGYNENSANRGAECGVTIHKPSDMDFGVWYCRIDVNGKIQGSVINVINTRGSSYNGGRVIDHRPVYVKRDDECKIACKANVRLKYCWLTSPNGTVYGVSKDVGSAGNSLKYEGNGLASGECGAKITNPESGEWTCHLGIDGGHEIQEKVSVIVTDTYLVASSDGVLAVENTNLTCRSFIGDRDTLDYCRWVRPNGGGIDVSDSYRYQLTKTLDECSLIILDPRPEDIGKWTCFASLTVKVSEGEQCATIEVHPTQRYRMSNALSSSLGSVLLITLFFTLTWAAIFVYRRRNPRPVDNLPPYPQDYIIPEKSPMPVEPTTIITNNNHKY